jgi:sugar lactone lactonase YvrE
MSGNAQTSQKRDWIGAHVVALLFLAGLEGVAGAAAGDRIADVVLGQPDFTSNAENGGGLGAATLRGPVGIAIAPSGRLYVADSNNNRVLSWPSATAATSGQAADLVIGQPDFQTNGANQGGLDEGSLHHPTFVTVDTAGNLWVADTFNHRVLQYEDPAVADVEADRVVGQTDFQTNEPDHLGLGPDGLNLPYGLAVDPSGNLWVADYGNNRILGYTTPLIGDTTADRVLGQPGFTTNDPNRGGRDDSSLSGPLGLSVDPAANLYVADFDNHRVLKYNVPFTGNEKADRVWGQPDFEGGIPNNGGLGANGLFRPEHGVLDAAGTLWVADRGNNRVLEYRRALTDSRNAERAFGQPSLLESTPNNGGLGPQGLSTPLGVAIDGAGNLWVVDFENNRVLRYDDPAAGPPPPPGGTNRPPTIATAPSAVPGVAGIGQSVAFSVAAVDEDGDPLTYTWDFGDGAVGSGADVTHAYAAAGSFTATVTVADDAGAAVVGSVGVTIRAPLVGTGDDRDGDGFSDAFETSVGTSALDATSTPLAGAPVERLEPLTVSGLRIALRFTKPSRDAIALRASVPFRTGAGLAGAPVIVDVGGVTAVFRLGPRGKAGGPGRRLAVKRASGRATCALDLKRGDFAATLAAAGLEADVEAKTVTRQVRVVVLFDGAVYAADVPLAYTTRGGRAGMARPPR